MRIRYNSKLNEVYFVFYLFLFIILKPITSTHPEISTMLLLATTLVVLFLSILQNRVSKINIQQWVLYVVGVGGWLLFDFLFRKNGMQGEIVYSFVIYAVIPLFLLTSVKCYNTVLKTYMIISIVVGLLFFVDPFNGYKWSGDYMQLGVSVLLPAFCGTMIGIFYFEKKILYVLMIAFLGEMLMCANKGTFLAAVVLLVLAYIWFNQKSNIKWMRVVSFTAGVFFVYILRLQLFDWFVSLADKMGFYSYSLTTIRMVLSGKENMVLGSRINIWESAIQVFKSAPFFGNGFGYYESLASSRGYAHNVELDILIATGIFGFLIYLILFVVSLYKIVKCKDYSKRIFLMILLVTWFVPMQFSLTLWKVTSFWIYWGVVFYTQFSYDERPTIKSQANSKKDEKKMMGKMKKKASQKAPVL